MIAAMFAPVTTGTLIDRKVWPAHVTLASNFRTAASAAQLVNTVGAAVTNRPPITLELAGEAMFGSDHDMLVQLVRSSALEALHAQLADALEALDGFDADTPDYWRGGYRPHVTHMPMASVAAGDRRTVNTIVIANLFGSHAEVIAAFDAAGE